MSITGRGLRYWLPYYLWQQLRAKERPDPKKPIHVFVCIVDHFEPFNGGVDYPTALKRVKTWRKEYPLFADRHRDTAGKPIQHTWFYPPHLDHRMLPYLVELCMAGYGDIEMHLHHNHMKPFPDTSETLRSKILQCIDDYGKYGIFCQPDGKPRFAFVHGDWSLDNSGGSHLCGVNDELTILRECGCYADFTFPCLNQSQPAMVNRIYYAVDDPEKPKSYNKGNAVAVNSHPSIDALMLIQGVMGLRYDDKKIKKIAIEYSDLNFNSNPTVNRMQYWLKNALTIKGKPNFKFIKLHTHGAPENNWEANWGKEANEAYTYLEDICIDSEKYSLHYVAAREMYNFIKAIEKRETQFSKQYRNVIIKPYLYEL